MRPTAMTAVALIAAATVAAAPATAKPHKPTKPKAQKFSLAIEGEQLTTWNYIKQQAPSCDYPEYGNGRQYISFGTYEHGDTANPKVTVKPKKGGGVAVEFARKDVTLYAEADLTRNYRVLYSQMSDCPSTVAGPTAADGPVKDEIGTNKCRTDGELDIYLGSSIGEVENPSYPTDLPNDPEDGKDRFYFAADPYWSFSDSYHTLPALCDEQGQYNADIGLTVSQGEWGGAIVPVGDVFSARKLLAGKKRTTKIELNRTVKYPNTVQTRPGPEHTTGKTVVDATFTFTRLKK